MFIYECKSSEQNKMQCSFVLQGSCIPGKLKNIPGYLNDTKKKKKENISFVVYM